MVGDFDGVGGVHVMVGAETGDALQDRGAGDAAIEEKVEDAGIDRRRRGGSRPR